MGALRALRWSGGSLLGLLAGLLGLVGVLLCVTLILLPLGIPILYLSRKLFRAAGQLVVPRAARHPVEELGKKGRESGTKGGKAARAAAGSVGEGARKLRKKAADVPLPQRRSRMDRVRRKLHLA